MVAGRDHWWHDIVDSSSDFIEAEALEAEHPLFILYTSGSTGRPKGGLHSTGAYLLGATMSCKYVFDMKDEDVYWCSADVGWITGHSYNVYGPLSNGAQILIYEGAPNYPDPSRLFCQLGLSEAYAPSFELCFDGKNYGITMKYEA